MKYLIAIVSCLHPDKQELCRGQERTWLKNLPHKFFVGNGRESTPLVSSTVYLDAPDDYSNLPLKVQAMCQWVLRQNEYYDFVFKCDDDYYAIPQRLLGSDFRMWNYYGHVRFPYGENAHIAYCHGGAGYWLSRKSVKVVAEGDPKHFLPGIEDGAVARCLAEKGIFPHHDERYRLDFHYPTRENDWVNSHKITVRTMNELEKTFGGNT